MAKGQIKQKQDKIDKKTFENLCEIQCTEKEICAVLEVSHDTLNRWCKETYNKDFANTFEEKREGGKSSLRRIQWHLAEKNPTMAIFLGKNYLGQRDNYEVTNKEELSKLDELLNEMKLKAEEKG